jgi:hypothetical protein
MSVEELIKQTIQHGNIFESIEYNIFAYQELIDYLAKNANEIPIDKLREAYSALLRYYPPTYHYSYGKHLLTYFPKDDFIFRSYCILGGSPELPLNKDEPSNTLWSLIFDFYSEFLNETWNEEIEKTMLLCNKITHKLAKKTLIDNSKDFIKKLFTYRCDKIISALPLCGIPSKNTKIYYVETDWFDNYPNILPIYENYIHRCNFVRLNCTSYYAKLIDQFQTALSQLTLSDFERLDVGLLKITRECFPTQFSQIDIQDQFFKLTIYPLTVRAYILGFSCYPKLPQKQEIDEAMLKLETLGIEKYVSSVLSKDNIPEEKIANTEDTLFENPEHYSPIDRIDVEENGKVYRFTRPEFAKLYTDKSNFWTKTKLTYSDLNSIGIRINICKLLNLPPSDTLQMLIEKAAKGILFKEPEQPKPTPPSVNANLEGQHLTTNQLIHLFQNMFNVSNQSIIQALNMSEGQAQGQELQSQDLQGEEQDELEPGEIEPGEIVEEQDSQ